MNEQSQRKLRGSGQVKFVEAGSSQGSARMVNVAPGTSWDIRTMSVRVPAVLERQTLVTVMVVGKLKDEQERCTEIRLWMFGTFRKCCTEWVTTVGKASNQATHVRSKSCLCRLLLMTVASGHLLGVF